MSIHVFLGPSLPLDEARHLLDADYRPPVAQGDVLRSCREGARSIAIVDGFFENVPSVWHKEILFALSSGIAVYGAASMGALRAAELYPFGMMGVGCVFEAYRDGRLEDDDEVAVTHGPAELGYPLLSEAMVNIRRTLAEATVAGVVDPQIAFTLLTIAKELPYSQRTYARILRQAAIGGLDDRVCNRFRRWLPNGRIDQKREDATTLLRMLATSTPSVVSRIPAFRFEHTRLWDQALCQTP